MKRIRMKSITALLLSVAMLIMLTACGGSDVGNGNGENGGNENGGNNGDVVNPPPDGGDNNPGTGTSDTNLSGTAEEVLQQLLDAIAAAGVETPMALPPLAPLPDMVQYDIGLSEADYNRLVETAASSVAAIGTFAHQIIIIQAKSPAMASEVKTLVSGDGGYDAQKLICVFPDIVITVESGNYVLIAASSNEIVGAALDAFKAAAGTVGTVVTFWDFASADIDPDAGFGGGGLEIIP